MTEPIRLSPLALEVEREAAKREEERYAEILTDIPQTDTGF